MDPAKQWDVDPDDAIDFRLWLNAVSWLEWNAVHTVTFDQLFNEYVEPDISVSLLQDLCCISQSITDSFGAARTSLDITESLHATHPGWHCITMDDHACYVASSQYPGRTFAVFRSAAGHVPCSFFTQVVAMRKVRQFVEANTHRGVCVPDMRLIPLFPKHHIETSRDVCQSRMFALTIPIPHVLNDTEATAPGQSMKDDPATWWLFARLCCLGFPVSPHFWTLTETCPNEIAQRVAIGMLTDARSCVVLDEQDSFEGQYGATQAWIQAHMVSRRHLAETNLKFALTRLRDHKTLSTEEHATAWQPFRHVLKVARHELETMQSQAGRTFRFLKKSGLFDKPLAEQLKAAWWVVPPVLKVRSPAASDKLRLEGDTD
jgi:hypothetical protein